MSARVSVLVPTRNEADNVAPLLERIERCFASGECEVVFADYSDDDTPERVRLAAATSPLAVVLLARPRGARDGGLGGAVLAGARTALSRTLAWTTGRLFPERLRGVTDPMTGFFVVRRAKLEPERLHPDGFKILLEILVRTPDLRVAEIPFRFDVRHAGRSKAGLREVIRLGRTLARLVIDG